MKKLSVALCLLFPLTVTAAPALKGNTEDLRGFLHPRDNIINISAEAEETAYSDQAMLNLVITTEEDKLSDAIKKNASLREQIKQTLISKGIPVNKINNSNFSSSSEYGWFGDEPDSYKVMNRIAIEISQEKQLQIIAELADQYEEAKLSATTFKHSKKEAYNQKVKQKALEKVLAKKNYYEQALGIKLTPVSFNESNIRFQATDGANVLGRAVMAESAVQFDKSYASKRAKPAAPKTNSFDEVKYRGSITVQFKVQ
jgi:uncharacterized protein YggE